MNAQSFDGDLDLLGSFRSVQCREAQEYISITAMRLHDCGLEAYLSSQVKVLELCEYRTEDMNGVKLPPSAQMKRLPRLRNHGEKTSHYDPVERTSGLRREMKSEQVSEHGEALYKVGTEETGGRAVQGLQRL